ncbi:phage tail protein [Enterobacter sp. KBR-315C3_2022]|uniref:phage tail protein n=1 Tax=Enterobacter sp. KBR-315C3_2022 TaxID=3242494 RepID=UPI0035295854
MNDFLKKLAGMALPSWMDQGEPKKLLKAVQTFWAEIYGWVTWPLRQFDPLTCNESILTLLAWDRDISRFKGEPLKLFRRRVAYAFVNAADAGSVEGFINIFDRLGIGYVELRERQPGIDWDVILVRVSDSQIADNAELMIQIIRQYGRTCRRYQFEVITSENLAIRAGWDQGEYVVYPARIAGAETSSATFSASLQGE